jgi:hypothetical protein
MGPPPPPPALALTATIATLAATAAQQIAAYEHALATHGIAIRLLAGDRNRPAR